MEKARLYRVASHVIESVLTDIEYHTKFFEEFGENGEWEKACIACYKAISEYVETAEFLNKVEL